MSTPRREQTDRTRTMSAADWDLASSVLTRAAPLPPEERARLLKTALADPTLREDCSAVLAAHDRMRQALGVNAASALGISPTATLGTESPAGGRVQIGQEYGPYRVLRSLGAGGMGEVFLAEDVRLGRRVALKSLGGQWTGSVSARRRLLREARAVAALSHPNIATLHDVIEQADHFLLVMEYVEGRSAAEFVKEGPLPLGFAVRLVLQICDAVVYAHDRGIVHCDLKPANVQVTPEGVAKVLDFGLAHARYEWDEFDAGAAGSQGLLVGTPAYMPPERLRAGTVNVLGDVYSIGVTLFELVTGRRPYQGRDMAALTGAILLAAPPRPSTLAPACPPALDDVVARAMARDPRHRYQAVREISTQLRELLSVLDSDSMSGVFVPTGTARLASRPWMIALLGLGAAASLTLLGFLTSTFYGAPLLLSMDFEGEAPWTWPVWGLRALFVPFGQVAVILLAAGGAHVMWRGLWSTPLRGLCQRVLAAGARIGEALRPVPTVAVAAVVLAVQAGLLWLALWRFDDLFAVFNNYLNQSGSLAALSADYYEEHLWYQRVFAALALGFAWSWYAVGRRRLRRAESSGLAIRAAFAVVLMIAIGLTVAPWRLFFHNESERVRYQSEVCYLVGRRGGEAQLFCPFAERYRALRVDLADPELERTGTTESIFSPWSAEASEAVR